MKRSAVASAAIAIGLGLALSLGGPANAQEYEQIGDKTCPVGKEVVIKINGAGNSTTKMGARWFVGGIYHDRWFGNTDIADRYILTGYRVVTNIRASGPYLNQAETYAYCAYS